MTSQDIKNLYPDWDENLPTSVVVIGTKSFTERELSNGKFVEITVEPSNRPAASVGVFRVEFVENEYDPSRDPGYKIGLNRNIAEACGFQDLDSLEFKDINIKVGLEAGQSKIEECKKVEVCPYGFDNETLEQFLREDNYLLHQGIDEVVFANSGSEQIPFYVADVEPSGWTTRVTDQTTINFVSENDAMEYKSERTKRYAQDAEDEQDQGDANTPVKSESGEIEFSLDFRRPESEDFDGSFDKIAGLDSVKERAKVVYGLSVGDIRQKVKQHGEFFVPDEGNAVLLYGPPGCGKTMISKAIANEFEKKSDKPVAFAEVEGSDILGRYQGVSEKRLSKAFADANNKARDNYFTILMFDEIESLVQGRSGDVKAHHQQLTATFLQEMNEVDRDVLVIAATNLPYDLDSAAVRRFNTEIFVPHPGKEGLKEFWEIRLKDINTEDTISEQDIEDLAEASVDFAPSELDNRLLQSEIQSDLVMAAMRDDYQPITKEYLLDKVNETDPQVIDRYVGEISQDINEMEGYQDLQEYIVERRKQRAQEESAETGKDNDENS